MQVQHSGSSQERVNHSGYLNLIKRIFNQQKVDKGGNRQLRSNRYKKETTTSKLRECGQEKENKNKNKSKTNQQTNKKKDQKITTPKVEIQIPAKRGNKETTGGKETSQGL